MTPALAEPPLGPELAYMLAREWQGRGLVTEAARAVVDPPNLSSRRVAQKLGFSYEGTRRVYGTDGMVVYRLDAAGTDRLKPAAGSGATSRPSPARP